MNKQRGIVLIAALIILIICSFIAVGIGHFAISSKQDTSAQFTQLQGYVDASSALSRADFLFKNAMSSAPDTLIAGNPNSIVTTFDSTPYWWQKDNIWQSKGTTFTNYTSNTGVTPRFRMEFREFVAGGGSLLATEKRGRNIYRVIARGGDADTSTSIIESYFTTPAVREN